MLVVDNLTLSHATQTCVSALHLQILSGDMLFLKGPNGCGKTTLLRTLAGLQAPNQGDIRYEPDTLIESIAYLASTPALFKPLSARQNLEMFLPLHCLPAGMALMGQFLSSTAQNRPLYQLSSGQQQQVALVRLLASQKKIWLLDEPDTHLDTETRGWLWHQLKAHADEGGIVIMASHASEPPSDVRCLLWREPGRCVLV